jgi:transposase
MKRVHRSYTSEFRLAAVQQVIDGQRSIPAVARSLEISPKTLENWVLRARKCKAPVGTAGGKPVTELEAEVTRLRQEVVKLRMEKEILKKAAAYFAKESM